MEHINYVLSIAYGDIYSYSAHGRIEWDRAAGAYAVEIGLGSSESGAYRQLERLTPIRRDGQQRYWLSAREALRDVEEMLGQIAAGIDMTRRPGWRYEALA